MTMEADLTALLGANGGISALIGKASGAPSISWGLPGQGWPWPALVLVMVTPGRDYTHAGPDGLDGPRIQIDVLAETDVSAAAVAVAVLAAIEAGGTVGTTGNVPSTGRKIPLIPNFPFAFYEIANSALYSTNRAPAVTGKPVRILLHVCRIRLP